MLHHGVRGLLEASWRQNKLTMRPSRPARLRGAFPRYSCAHRRFRSNSTLESEVSMPRNMRMKQATQYMAEKLKSLESVSEPRLEASILMSVALNEPRDVIVADYNRILTEEETQHMEQVLSERLKEKPVPYISGVKEFYGRSFSVSKDTLIPRPATETLVSETLKAIRAYFTDTPTTGLSATPTQSVPTNTGPVHNFNLLELGVGSGCVIVSLVSELNQRSSLSSLQLTSDSESHGPESKSSSSENVSPRKWLGTGVDRSKGALKVSEQNAVAHGVSDVVTFYESNWMEELVGTHNVKTKWDVVVSNPPYLTDFDWESAPRIMRDFEPSSAFLGGPDGLDCYRDIHLQIPPHLQPGALVCLEIGAWQEEGVVSIFQPDFALIKKARDLEGHMRVLIFRFKGRHPSARTIEKAN